MVAAVAVAVLLGLWQLHVWEAARAAEARDLSQAKPLPLSKVMTGDSPFPGQYLGQPVRFTGEWLGEGTLYVSDRALNGKRGYWVMTPVLVGDSAIPVVRGWSSSPEASVPSGAVEVDGWLQASEGTGQPDDDPRDDVIPEMRIASIVEHVDADLYSGYVVAKDTRNTGSTATGGAATAGLERVPPESVPEVSNVTSLRNLLYALQWWVFGGAAVYVWVRWCRDTWERDREVQQVPSSA
jgi:surfeit locus 1 family protein